MVGNMMYDYIDHIIYTDNQYLYLAVGKLSSNYYLSSLLRQFLLCMRFIFCSKNIYICSLEQKVQNTSGCTCDCVSSLFCKHRPITLDTHNRYIVQSDVTNLTTPDTLNNKHNNNRQLNRFGLKNIINRFREKKASFLCRLTYFLTLWSRRYSSVLPDFHPFPSHLAY